MKKSEIFGRLDHTELRPTAMIEDFRRLAKEAREFGVATVCVPPSMVRMMRALLKAEVPICTVVGFPLGYTTVETKVFEAQEALKNGAREIDVVINQLLDRSNVLGGPMNQMWLVREELQRLRQVCRGATLKVIVETCYLCTEQKIRLCELITEVGVEYIKTSTGFGLRGAELEDMALFREHLGSNVKIKAAGGISTVRRAKEFLEAGAERIGSSNVLRALAEIEGDEL